MTEELPKQDLLLKMLRMTESDNDGQALVAIRKANALLQSAGWTWEKLLSGKITVVADPFASMPEINREAPETRHAPATPPPPRRAASRTAAFHSWSPSPKQPRPAMPTYPPGAGMKWEWSPRGAIWESVKDYSYPPPNPLAVLDKEISSRTNNYANHCYCCGTDVPHRDGFIFQGADFGLPSKWNTVCKSCNTTVKTIPRTPAKRKITNSTFQARVPNSAIDNL